jgi:hypothetical protein
VSVVVQFCLERSAGVLAENKEAFITALFAG